MPLGSERPEEPGASPLSPELPHGLPSMAEAEAVTAERLRPLWTALLLGAASVMLVLVLAYAHYHMMQAPHRLTKALLAAALLFVIVSRPTWSLLLLPLAFSYLEWLPISPIPLLNASNLLFFSLIFGWVGRTVYERRRFLDPSPWNVPMGVFLVWAFFSWLIGTAHQGGDFHYALASFQEFWSEMTGLVLFFMIFNNVRSWAEIRRLALAFCVGTALGLVPLLYEFLRSGGGKRVGGGVGQLNVAGAFFATAALFSLGLLSARYRGFWRRILLLGSVLGSIVGMVLPGSRGAFVGFLLGELPQVYRAGVVALVIMALIVGGFVLWAPAYVKDRVEQTQEAAMGEDGNRYDAVNKSSGGRLEFWKASVEIIKGHPVLGVGFGRTQIAMEDYVGAARAPHNAYLALAGDMGIPGLLFFLSLFWIALRASGALLAHPGFPRGLGLAYRAAMTGLLVTNIFGGRIFCLSMGGIAAFLTALVFRAQALLREGIPDGSAT